MIRKKIIKQSSTIASKNIRLFTNSTTLNRPHKSKSTLSLLNSLFVFKLCAITPLVRNSQAIITAFEKLQLSSISNLVVKKTFFKHFCGGEDLTEVLPTMSNFQSSNVGSILDFALETDYNENEKIEKSPKQALEDSLKIIDMFKSSIDIAKHQTGSFIAVKITALIPPPVLLRWTNSLRKFKAGFGAIQKDGGVDRAGFVEAVCLGNVEAGNLFNSLEKNDRGLVDWTTISEKVDAMYKSTQSLIPLQTTPTLDPELELLTPNDIETIQIVLKEIENLCHYAVENNVRIMIDAEQTYFQPAIDNVTLHLSRTVNPTLSPVVFNTYQLYLKDAYERLVMDVERAKRFGYTFGVKIVRGAYMTSERARAKEYEYTDPINETLDKTHKQYNKAIEFLTSVIASNTLQDKVPKRKQLSFVVATHNRESVEKAVGEMEKNSILPKDGTVGFAQLMGMQDGVTFGLGGKGYSAYKYIPYGPVSVTIPYLIRRAQENAGFMKSSGVALDKKELLDELKFRLRLQK